MDKKNFAVVLPAGGLGKRMGSNIPKQLMELKGKRVYLHSLEKFLSLDEIVEVVLAVPAEWKTAFEEDLSKIPHPEKLKIVIGGSERWESVKNGVNALTSDAQYVLVHDVARPFLSERIIKDVCSTLVNQGACLVAKPAVDTIKVARDGKVEKTIDRNTVWLAQTPQAANIQVLKELYSRMEKEPLHFTPTDEASILEYFGIPVYIVKGEAANDKLTSPEDFARFS
ncbi:MAG: 2-C-methyl-D-erythritol 4-phosphate cytidylyltransferase [Fibrobacteraceae bacterium]|nr:2-C-methyl-D-erythritol 4-phosphate cytidylyltransferase [Fibrobacteraceae bacterium]